MKRAKSFARNPNFLSAVSSPTTSVGSASVEPGGGADVGNAVLHGVEDTPSTAQRAPRGAAGAWVTQPPAELPNYRERAHIILNSFLLPYPLPTQPARNPIGTHPKARTASSDSKPRGTKAKASGFARAPAA